MPAKPRALAQADTPAHTILPADDAFAASRRQDGWSAASQRAFLERLAEGCGVEAACRHVGLSSSSAYSFRRTAKGAAFALGWRAAALVARDAVAETLMVRALDGTVDTVTRGDVVITRHKFDNRLALSLLARLDRQMEAAADADVKAARLVAQEFDAYLDLVGRDEGPARAGLFLARRCGSLADDETSEDLAPIYALAAADRFARTGVATAGEVDVRDLDPAARAGWTAEQWARAEAAGLVALAPPAPADDETASSSQHSQHSDDADDANGDGDGDTDPLPVWYSEDEDEWYTVFPPPADFKGVQQGEFGERDYQRALDGSERAAMERAERIDVAALREKLSAERDRWFASIPSDEDWGGEQGSVQAVEPDEPSGHRP